MEAVLRPLEEFDRERFIRDNQWFLNMGLWKNLRPVIFIFISLNVDFILLNSIIQCTGKKAASLKMKAKVLDLIFALKK